MGTMYSRFGVGPLCTSVVLLMYPCCTSSVPPLFLLGAHVLHRWYISCSFLRSFTLPLPYKITLLNAAAIPYVDLSQERFRGLKLHSKADFPNPSYNVKLFALLGGRAINRGLSKQRGNGLSGTSDFAKPYKGRMV